jgi:hypothetical protein
MLDAGRRRLHRFLVPDIRHPGRLRFDSAMRSDHPLA